MCSSSHNTTDEYSTGGSQQQWLNILLLGCWPSSVLSAEPLTLGMCMSRKQAALSSVAAKTVRKGHVYDLCIRSYA